MPELSRRRSREAHQECWHIFYGDVRVGTITERAGVPHDVDQWGWQCGFFPLTHRGEHAEGTAASFEQARAAFETAWNDYLPKCTAAEKMPTSLPSGRSHCFCGAAIDIAGIDRHVYEAHMTEPRL
jgi:hypothetical protein